MQNKALHILLVSSWFPSDKHETEGSFVWEQALALQKRGHKVHVLKPNFSGTAKEFWTGKSYFNPGIRKYRFGNIPVTEIVQAVPFPKIGQYNYAFLYRKAEAILGAYIRRFGKPDLIHSHAAFVGGVCAAHLSLSFSIPLVHTEHTSGLIFNPSQYSPFEKEQYRFLVKHAAKVLFVSHFAKKESQHKMQVEISQAGVLPNLVDALFFNIPMKQDGKYYVCFGNYIPRKNQDFLWEVWKIWHKKHKDARLIFIGDGFENAPWYKEAEYHNIDFKAKQSRVSTSAYIADSKALLSVSKVETFGLTLAEAMACGKPVIALDSGGPADFVKDPYGLLLQNRDITTFIEALEKIESKQYQAAEEIRAYALQHFSEDVICRELETIYKALL